MISPKVFQNLSRKTGIKAEALEKDYVMNLILDAMAHCPATRGSFFFKGGCCVHKCFSSHVFEDKKKGVDDYFLKGRFSSDIDLTVRPEVMKTDELQRAFRELRDYLIHRHGLEIGDFSFPIHENPKRQVNGHNRQNCRGLIRFKGPMYNHRFNPPALKFDITADERVVFPPYKRVIYHPYSNEGEELVLVALTYTLRDIFAEKIRALFERCSPRDVYDLNTLIHHPDLDKKREIGIGLSVMEKFRLKNVPIDLNVNRLTEGQSGTPSAYDRCRLLWRVSLGRQMTRIPAFETCWSHMRHIVDFADRCVVKAQQELDGYCHKYGVSQDKGLHILMEKQAASSERFQSVIDRHIKTRQRKVKDL